MKTTQVIRQEEKNCLLLKIIMWAQKQKKQVETLTYAQVIEAIRCKF